MEEQKVAPKEKLQVFPGPIALCKEAWDIYSQRMTQMLGIMFGGMFVMVGAIIILFLIGLAVGIFFKAQSIEFIISVTILVVLVFIIFIIYSAWVHLAMVFAAVHHQEQIGIREAYKKTWGLINSYWWIQFLTGLIIMSGFILFVLPGSIFMVWFSLVSYVLVAENIKGMNVLLKSREYVRGRFWEVLGRLVFLMALSFLPSAIELILFPGQHRPPAIYSVLSVVYGILLAPFSVLYGVLLYEKLKALRGEFAFQPTSKQKIPYIVIAIFAIVLPIIFFGVFMFTVFPKLINTYLPLYKDAYNTPYPSITIPTRDPQEIKVSPPGYKTSNPI